MAAHRARKFRRPESKSITAIDLLMRTAGRSVRLHRRHVHYSRRLAVVPQAFIFLYAGLWATVALVPVDAAEIPFEVRALQGACTLDLCLL